MKICTENDEESIFNIVARLKVTANPLKTSKTSDINLYYYNENGDYYLSKTEDIYDIDSDGNVADSIGFERKEISLVAPSGLLTTEYITDYNEEKSITIAPNIAEINRTDEARTAKINVSISNNYSGTISNIMILGKIPFEGNSYIISEKNLKSQYTANMVSGIIVPDDLKDKVKVYYSKNENPTKDLSDSSNNWKLAENVSNWSEIKSYLIDLNQYIMAKSENRIFTYEVNVPGKLGYNSASYCCHAVYYNLDTENGKLESKTETNKVGIQVVSKYGLQLTKNKKTVDNRFVKGAIYNISTTNDDDEIITKTARTDDNGVLKFNGLYVEKEYTLKEIFSPSDYVLNKDQIKFDSTINSSGNLEINVIEGSFKEQENITLDEKGNFLVNAKVEDVAKYTLVINKLDTEGSIIPNSKVTISQNEMSERTYKTDGNGIITIPGLKLNEEYELQDNGLDGYYSDSSVRRFTIVRNDSNILEIQTEDEVLNNVTIEETEEMDQGIVTVNFRGEKIPTYDLKIIKYEEANDPKVLTGACFKFVNVSTGKQKEYSTNENDYIKIEGLYQSIEKYNVGGEYIIQETKAPDGYSNNAEQIKFKVSKNEDESISVNIENKETLKSLKSAYFEDNTLIIEVFDKPLFKIIKADSETGVRLANAKFIIYEINQDGDILNFAKDINGNFVGEKNLNGEWIVTTNENGEISVPLKEGRYKIVEVGFPEGYYENPTEEFFEIGQCGVDVFINCIEDLIDLSNNVKNGNTYEKTTIRLARTLDFKDSDSYRDPTGINFELLNQNNETELNKINFQPIGQNDTNCFSGTFDGQGNEIKNLYIKSTDTNIGLFGAVVDGTIKNLTVSGNEHYYGNSEYGYLGGIVASSIRATIENCVNKVALKFSGNSAGYVGGIAGIVNQGKIINCKNIDESNDEEFIMISCEFGYLDKISYAGGVVGNACQDSYIENCNNSGKVKAQTSRGGLYIGGLSGLLVGKAENCYNTGEVDGFAKLDLYEGGLSGLCASGGLYNCYNTGDVDGKAITYSKLTMYTGGVVGLAYVRNIENCYNSGNVNGDLDSYYNNSSIYVGGIGGLLTKGTGTDGITYNCLVTNCYNVGVVKGVSNLTNYSTSYIGGISGVLSEIQISNCYNTGYIENISNKDVYTGGISGIVNADTENCYNSGDIKAVSDTSAYAGGIGATANNLCNKCYNIGNIECISNYNSSYAGGIFGINNKNNIVNVYNKGNINSTGYSASYVGGITGINSVNCIKGYNIGKVKSVSNNNSNNEMVGGITGIGGGSIIDCYYLNNDGYIIGNIKNSSGNSVDETYMKEDEIINILGNNIWSKDLNNENDGFPVWKKEIHEEIDETIIENIDCIEDLVRLSKQVNNGNKYLNKTIKLNKNLNFQNESDYENSLDISFGDLNKNGIIEGIKDELTNINGIGFTPIGNDKFFSGIFDGQNNKIENIYMNYNGYSLVYLGLFGKIDNAKIKNLTVTGNIKNNSINGYIGGIASYAQNSNIYNCHNKINIDLNITKLNNENNYFGGIVGYSSVVYIKNCDNEGNFYCDNFGKNTCFGGIAGKTYVGDIRNCYNKGMFNLNNNIYKSDSRGYVGGIVGYTEKSKIYGSYNNADILYDGRDIVFYGGGIVGESYYYSGGSELNKCYNLGKIYSKNQKISNYSVGNYIGGILGEGASNDSIKNCYNMNELKSESYYSYIGGILGNSYSIIKNCYNIGNIKDYSTNSSYVGAIVGSGNSTNITNNYYLDTIDRNGKTINTLGEAISQEQMGTREFYNSLNQDSVWGFNEGSYPTLIETEVNDNEFEDEKVEIEIIDGIEILIENTIKKYEITTSVEEHEEVDSEENTISVKGGKITGEDMQPYKTLVINNPQKIEMGIKIEPDEGYGISKIKINDEELEYVLDEDGTYTIPEDIFKNIKESKDIVVLFEKLNNILTIYKVDKNDKSKLKDAEFNITVNGETTKYKTNENGEIRVTAPSNSVLEITEIKAPKGYTLNSATETYTMKAEGNNVLEIENERQSQVVVHHYLKDSNGNYTENKVAEDDIYNGDLNKEYTTSPHIDLDKLKLEKEDNKYKIPEKATGTYTNEPIYVDYYYEAEPIELKIHHYIDGTQNKIVQDDIEYVTPEVIFDEEGNYSVVCEGIYDIKENQKYNNLLKQYDLTRLSTNVKENVEITDNLEFNKDAELSYYYNLKEYSISTKIEEHTEIRTDKLTNEKVELLVEGGTISGKGEEKYEVVVHGNDSTKEIVITPNDGYIIEKVTLNSKGIDGITTTILYGDKYALDAEITCIENADGSMTLSGFKEVTEDKEIVVKLAPTKGKVIVHHYMEGTGEASPEKLVWLDGSIIEDEEIEEIIGEYYVTQGYKGYNVMYEVVETSGETSGIMQEGVKHVYYYYRRLKQIITTEIIEHEEIDENGNKKMVKGGSISGEGESPYETVLKFNDSKKVIKIVPEKNYRIKRVLINGEEIELNNVSKDHSLNIGPFESVDKDLYIKAEFEIIPARVIVKYVDEETGEVIDTKEINGFVNRDYEIKEIIINGYEPVREKIPVNLKGKFTEEDIIVVYYYKKIVNEDLPEEEVKEEIKLDEEILQDNSSILNIPKAGQSRCGYIVLLFVIFGCVVYIKRS